MDPVVTTPIDPGEQWSAVLGIKPVLSKRVEKITDGQVAEALRVPETIAKRAKALVRDSLVSPAFDLVDYDRVLRETSDSIDIPQIEAMIRAVPGDDQLAYMTVANNCYNSLQAALPKSAWTTYAGTENLTPDFADLLKFSELYAVLDDPIAFIFGGIADGSIDRELATHVREILPTLTAAITEAITDAITEAHTKNKAFALPWRAEIGMAAWMGAPIETGTPAAPEPAPAATAKKPSESGDLDTEGLTPTEKLDAAK